MQNQEHKGSWRKAIAAFTAMVGVLFIATHVTQCTPPSCQDRFNDGIYTWEQKLACDRRAASPTRAVMVDGGTLRIDHDNPVLMPQPDPWSPCGKARNQQGQMHPNQSVMFVSRVRDDDPSNNDPAPTFVSVPNGINGPGRVIIPNWDIEHDQNNMHYCAGDPISRYASEAREISYDLASWPNAWTVGQNTHWLVADLAPTTTPFTYMGVSTRASAELVPGTVNDYQCRRQDLSVTITPELFQVTTEAWQPEPTQDVWVASRTVVWNASEQIPGRNARAYLSFHSSFLPGWMGIDSVAALSGQGAGFQRIFNLVEINGDEGLHDIDCLDEPAWLHHWQKFQYLDNGCGQLCVKNPFNPGPPNPDNW